MSSALRNWNKKIYLEKKYLYVQMLYNRLKRSKSNSYNEVKKLTLIETYWCINIFVINNRVIEFTMTIT